MSRLKLSRPLFASLLVAGALIAVLAAREAFFAQQAAEKFPPPGRLVEVDGRQMQIDCRGSGSPTVVLHSGGQDIFGSLEWVNVHDQIATSTRVCAYSRAGYMWSDSRTEPLDAEGGARDLRAALDAANETPPFVLAGYSRGAFNTLIFADLFGADVAGLVLLEPRHPELESRRAQAGIDAESSSPLRLAQLARALRWSGLPRVFASYCEASWYTQQVTDACKAFFPHSLDGIVSEETALPVVRTRASRIRDLGDRPLLVLTRQFKDEWYGSNADTRAALQKSESLWRQLHAEMASWSSRGAQRLVPDSTHSLPLTHPQQVTSAVQEVVAAVRQTLPVTASVAPRLDPESL